MFSSNKPYSAVTVAIEKLTGDEFEDDSYSGIPDLVEAINLQGRAGVEEAARAIRKKLKYGNVHRQIRALVILDGLIQNAGPLFRRSFADEMLLDRLRVCGRSELSDELVRGKCRVLFRSWAHDYKGQAGLEKVCGLYNQIPHRKQVVTQATSKVLRETEENPFVNDEEEAARAAEQAQRTRPTQGSSTGAGHASSSSIGSFKDLGKSKKEKEKAKDKDKKKHKPFNLKAETPVMKGVIAEATMASTNLMNALRRIDRDKERISENKEAVHQFEVCKLLRRKILRYIQHIEKEPWIGPLLNANDELINALITFEQLDKSIDADSDSEDEMAFQNHKNHMKHERSSSASDVRSPTSPVPQLAGLRINSPPHERPAPPPRPIQEQEESEDEAHPDDPFADSHHV